MKKRIAIFASGTGTNAQKIISHFKNAGFAEVVLIVSNRPDAGVLHIAKKEGIPSLLIKREDLKDPVSLLKQLEELKIDLVVLAGFLWKIPVALIRNYPNRIVNIHPALLPDYGGRGMYGRRVHEAVIAAGEKESGITIHYINENYDEGEIILQKKCTIEPGEDAKNLAQKVQQLEHQWFPEAIEKIIREDIEK